MASAAVDSSTTANPGGELTVDSIPVIDLHHLSQSELYTLSLCSRSAFDPCRSDDIVIPKIDRSIFNESAGSRKQTYSRLRLAPPEASSTATLRRRTFHVRSPNSVQNHDLSSPHFDPENVENARIVALLKQLFVEEETNYAELVPVKIDFTDSLPQVSNVGSTGSKRKRGRPRKNENAVPLVQDEGNENEFDVDVNAEMKDILIYENVEDRDKETLNRDGVDIDLLALGALEDPYGEELRRRTEGLGTEEELLGYLQGLNGQWGSRRKKKRIVDASEFGNALPRGWKLLLSLKKKEGRIWVCCRRYISPNGRNFASCKEVSSYLLSLHGVQSGDQPTGGQSNYNVNSAGNLVLASIADYSVQHADQKEILSSPAVTSVSSTRVQVTFEPSDLPNTQVGELFYCDKCNITFFDKDELLHHNLTTHKRKRPRGQSLCDGVIIKGGKYECQFCHKTFTERHRYNGHIGSHVRNQGKSADESAHVNVGEGIVPGSVSLVPPMGSVMQASIQSRKNAEETIYLSQSNKQGESGMVSDNNMKKTNEDVDLSSTKSDLCFSSEAVLSNNVQNDIFESAVDAHVSSSFAFISNVKLDEPGRNLESCAPPLIREAHIAEKNGIEVSACTMEPRREPNFENGLLSSNDNVEKSDLDTKEWLGTHASNKLQVEKDKLIHNDETVYDLCSSRVELEDKSVAGKNQQYDSEDCSAMNVMISTPSGTEIKRDSESIALSLSGLEETCVRDNVNGFLPSSVDEQKFDEMYFPSNGSGMFAGSGVSTKCLDSHSVASSLSNEAEVAGKYDSGAWQGGNCSSNLLSLSGHQTMCRTENSDEQSLKLKLQGIRPNEGQQGKSSELLFLSGSNSNALNTDSLGGAKEGRNLEFCSLFPSATEKTFSSQDNVTVSFSSAVEETNQETSGDLFLMPHRVEASDEVYAGSKIFSTTMNKHRLDSNGNFQNDDLRLGFSRPQPESAPNSIQFELERFPAGISNVNSRMEQTYGGQTNLNSTNHTTAENPKEGRGFGISLHDPSFNSEANEFHNNLNMVYPAQVWGNTKVDSVRNSHDQFSLSFVSNDAQSDVDVMAGNSWRPSEENLLQGSFKDTPNRPNRLGQPSSFHTFDITSNKAEGELFRVNNQYNCEASYGGLGSGRNGPVQYSLMASQSSNASMAQGFDSSFWLGKDGLMLNTAGRNQVPTTVCVWCRTEFYHDPIHSGVQGSAIGSMCPTCSARISQQFNGM